MSYKCIMDKRTLKILREKEQKKESVIKENLELEVFISEVLENDIE